MRREFAKKNRRAWMRECSHSNCTIPATRSPSPEKISYQVVLFSYPPPKAFVTRFEWYGGIAFVSCVLRLAKIGCEWRGGWIVDTLLWILYELLVAVSVLQSGSNFKCTLEPRFKQHIFIIFIVKYTFQNEILKNKKINSKRQSF